MEASAAGNGRWQADVILADGGTIHVRPIRPTDADDLVAFHERLSADSRYLRFFSVHPRLSAEEVERFTCVDMVDRVALVAELTGELLAVGRFDRRPGANDAEVAFVVADAHHGRGIATVLLEQLAAVARERGIARFTAEVLPSNRVMLAVFAAAGWAVTRTFDEGVVHVEMSISRGVGTKGPAEVVFMPSRTQARPSHCGGMTNPEAEPAPPAASTDPDCTVRRYRNAMWASSFRHRPGRRSADAGVQRFDSDKETT
ncbi:MAG: hypothetical protein QOE35_3473 [Actinomycetota bacterium]|jgi:GNAT superfamily N-acetyltransferase